MNIMDLINIPMGYVMRFFNDIVGNQYLLALFLFAIFIEIILIPFGIKQQKNSIKQAKLRPKEMAIRKKYAGTDNNTTKQKINEEIQALYQREGYSPFSGCLPLLIQMPVMIALYYIVLNPLKYICQFSNETIEGIISVVKSFPEYAEKASKFATDRTIDVMDAVKNIIETHGIDVFSGVEGFSERITSASDLPNVSFLGLNLAGTPSFTDPGVSKWLLLIPVLTFVAYFFSNKINRKLSYQPTSADDPATGCSNKMMDFMMPLMSVWICFMVPAAIGIYWIFKCVIGVGKQAILKVAMPIPKFTDADYKAAEKEYNASQRAEKHPKNSSSSGKGPKPGVRSLHHIDDEDYPDTAPAALERKKAAEKLAEENAENNSGKSSLIAPAPIKDDARPTKESKKNEDHKSDSDSNAENESKEDSEKN